MSKIEPTGEKGYFLNKKDGPHGVYFSKNLTPHTGKNYLTVNVGSDGALTTIKAPGIDAVPLKENRNGKGYNAIVDGYRVFAKPITTKFGDCVVIDVVENEDQEQQAEFNEDEKKTYGGGKSFSRK